MSKPALTKRLREIGDTLHTLSFEPNVWSEALAGLQSAFGAVLAVKYLPEKAVDGWSFESMETASAADACVSDFRERVLPKLSTHFTRYTFFDPLTPDAQQRDRALLLSDITELTGRPMGTMREYMGNLGINPWDQLRVLVCDGSRLLSWVGVYSEQPFTAPERAALQALVPALKARLRFDQLAQHGAQVAASLEATMELVPVPCFLFHVSGRLLDANASGRLLQKREPELVRQIDSRIHERDPRFQVYPIRVRGIATSYLVTLRAPGRSAAPDAPQRARQWGLTKRQATVLGCVVDGLANKEIASRLNIAPGTVELHVTAILAKVRVESRAALIAAYWNTRG